MELLIFFACHPPPQILQSFQLLLGTAWRAQKARMSRARRYSQATYENFHMEMNKRAPWHRTDNRKIVPAVHFPIFLLKPRRASASNGAQQRLDSPVRTGDPRAVTPDCPQRATAAPLLVPSHDPSSDSTQRLNVSPEPLMGPQKF